MIHFFSDPHFWHSRIIEHCKRPFESVVHMNDYIIKNINDKVDENDTLYCLGDFSFGGIKKICDTREQINCKNVHLILGNHDKEIRKKLSKRNFMFGFQSIQDYLMFDVNGRQSIILFHYPIASWASKSHGSWMISGHCHGNYKPGLVNDCSNGLILDVGVDVHDFKPVSFDEVAEIMNKKKISMNKLVAGSV